MPDHADRVGPFSVVLIVVLLATLGLVLLAVFQSGPPFCPALDAVPYCVEVGDPVRRLWN